MAHVGPVPVGSQERIDVPASRVCNAAQAARVAEGEVTTLLSGPADAGVSSSIKRRDRSTTYDRGHAHAHLDLVKAIDEVLIGVAKNP